MISVCILIVVLIASLTLIRTNLITNTITGSSGTFSWIPCTGTSGRFLTATTQGVYIGSASVGSAAIEIRLTGNQYIDFTAPHVEFNGRQLYDTATNEMRWSVHANSTLRMMLKDVGLTIYGTVTSSSDKR